MYKVLILDDDQQGLDAAIAGLIPLPPSFTDDQELVNKLRIQPEFSDIAAVHIGNRVDLAKENYLIQEAANIKEFMKKLDLFKPDLIIIDIDTKDEEARVLKHNDTWVTNGILLYRYLESIKYPAQKILFTFNFATQQYVNKYNLSESEKLNLIPKTQGPGFELLASAISKYIDAILFELMRLCTPDTKNDVLKEISRNENNWERLMGLNIDFSGRKIAYKHFIIHKSFPVFRNEIPQLVYIDPLEKITEIFLNTQGDATKGVWESLNIQQALSLFIDRPDFENNVNKISSEIIREIIKNIPLVSNYSFLLTHSKNIKYRLVEYAKKGNTESTIFQEKLFNNIALHRVFIFFELLNRNLFDTSNGNKLQEKYKKFLEQFVTHIFMAVDKSPTQFTSNNLQQKLHNFNLGYNRIIDNDNKLIRERIEFVSLSRLELERKWLSSNDKINLTNEITAIITRSR